MLLPGVLALTVACSRQPDPLELIDTQVFTELEAGTAVSLELGVVSVDRALVEVIAHEADVETRLLDADGGEIRKFRVPNTRLPPTYFVLNKNAPSADGTLLIKPINLTKQAEIAVRIYELSEAGAASQRLAEAYDLYSQALATEELTDQNYEAVVAHLRKAAELFRATGRQEQALWADAIAVRILVWPALDFGAAFELSHRAVEEARQKGFGKVELMLSDSNGVVLTEICTGNPYHGLLEAREAGLNHFRRAGELASQLDLEFEVAWARNNSGIASYYLDRTGAALEHYQQASVIARQLQDEWLTGVIEGNMSLARESEGSETSLAEGLAHWQQEVARLRAAKNEQGLPHALILLGRAYLKLHMFPESIAALSEALESDLGISQLHDSSRAHLWLAYAYYSIGDLDRAASLFQRAIGLLKQANDCRSLRSAHGWMADLDRERGRIKSSAAHRAEQLRYTTSALQLARYHIGRAEDALAGDPDNSELALDEFRQAIAYLDRADHAPLRSLTRLKLCAVAIEQAHTAHDCEFEELLTEYQAIAQRAAPRTLVEGMQAWGGILIALGRTQSAITHFGAMIDQVRFYRQTLPGVLGSWYWERRGSLFEQYLALLAARDQQAGDGIPSLIALDKLRNLETKSQRAGHDPAAESKLRNLVLMLDSRRYADEAEATRREIELLLTQTKGPDADQPELTEDWLRTTVRSLEPGVALVTFHFSPHGTWRWWLNHRGVRLDRLAGPGTMAGEIRSAKENFRALGYEGLESELEMIGEALLGAIPDTMPGTLFLLSGASLNGFPFDALRPNGGYLGESTTVINLHSLQSLAAHDAGQHPGFERIFAGGASQWQSLQMPDLPMVDQELDLVEASFPAAHVHRAVNGAFNQDSFKGLDFRKADLIHLASHAQTNLEYPELSRIYFGNAAGPEDYLTPFGLDGLALGARLVVLSACDTSGSNAFTFESNLGFVSAFLANGVDSVMATLWPVADESGLQFMSAFYRQLAAGFSVIEAFGQAKRELLIAQRDPGNEQYFAYQLYLR